MKGNALSRRKELVLYGGALAALLFLLKWLEFRLLIVDHAQEIFTGCIAAMFTGLGIWIARKLSRPRVETVVVEKVADSSAENFVRDDVETSRLGLTSRELEVLSGMAEGLSNQEIGEKMFVSVNTVKTHSKNLFEKLNVTRRTQAVAEGKRLKLIP